MSYEKWMYVKTHEKGAKKLFAKLMLNNLCGKFVFERNIDYLLGLHIPTPIVRKVKE